MALILGIPGSAPIRRRNSKSPLKRGTTLESRAMPSNPSGNAGPDHGDPDQGGPDQGGPGPAGDASDAPVLIATDADLGRLVETLASVPAVGIDCEMDSMYAYRTSLCLLQIGWEGGEVLIDALQPLDWSQLQPVLADEGILKIFHGGENDIGLMASHWSLKFANIFDTSAAAQVVGREKVGLAALLKEHFDVDASKQHQRADWRVRPLRPELSDYALEDVRYLIPLYRILQAELEELDRVEEAHSEFARIRSACFEDRPFDPDSWVRVKGSREVPVKRRGVLAAVVAARDDIAKRFDRAPYRVARDHALLEMARRIPRQLEQIKRINGVARDLPEEEAQRFAAAVEAGAEVQELPLPNVPRRGGARMLGSLAPEQQELFDALRKWRTKRAKKRGVVVARVATNALLAAIVRAKPLDAEALAGVEGMEPWRMREYADDLLKVIREQE